MVLACFVCEKISTGITTKVSSSIECIGFIVFFLIPEITSRDEIQKLTLTKRKWELTNCM
jgi:hypothetical protein